MRKETTFENLKKDFAAVADFAAKNWRYVRIKIRGHHVIYDYISIKKFETFGFIIWRYDEQKKTWLIDWRNPACDKVYSFKDIIANHPDANSIVIDTLTDLEEYNLGARIDKLRYETVMNELKDRLYNFFECEKLNCYNKFLTKANKKKIDKLVDQEDWNNIFKLVTYNRFYDPDLEYDLYTNGIMEAFNHCKVYVLHSIEAIYPHQYQGSDIEKINLPENITTILYNGFESCRKLKEITLSDKLESIWDCAFYCCHNLTNINYQGTKEQWNAIDKQKHWNCSSAIKTIHCIDGDIEIESEEY